MSEPIMNESYGYSQKVKQGIIDWTEKNYGGRVIRVEQFKRWRPIWRVDVDMDGVIKSLAFKGPRDGDVIPYPIEHELNMYRRLEENGIPVPHVHGLCDYPSAVVMDWIPGYRDAGMVMAAAESESTMSDDRWTASLKYMDILADMHKIDPEKFLPDGCVMPEGAADIALNNFERFYQMGKDAKVVDPFMDFCRVWLHRNVPSQRNRISFVTGDCCQFLADGAEVTGVLDVEIGHLGDYSHDLACFLGRHPVENLGDIPALFRRYEKSLGEDLDLDAIAYHAVVFLAIGFFFPVLTLPVSIPGGGDWVESQVQVAFIARRCAEAMGSIIGIDLVGDMLLPAPEKTPLADMALDKLIREIQYMPVSEFNCDWKVNIVEKIPHWLRNQMHFGSWAEETDLDEAAVILGHRPDTMIEADKALSQFVLEAGPEHDTTLIRYFHRRNLRHCHIAVGPDAPDDHVIFAKFEPVLSI